MARGIAAADADNAATLAYTRSRVNIKVVAKVWSAMLHAPIWLRLLRGVPMLDCTSCLICKKSFDLGEMVMVITSGYIGKIKDCQVPITVANHRSDYYEDALVGCLHTDCLFKIAESHGVAFR